MIPTTGRSGASPTPQAAPGLAAAVFDFSRGRQALLSVAQPAMGAVLALGALPSPDGSLLGLVAATTGFLAVFSLNDLLDRKVDERALEVGKAETHGLRPRHRLPAAPARRAARCP